MVSCFLADASRLVSRSPADSLRAAESASLPVEERSSARHSHRRSGCARTDVRYDYSWHATRAARRVGGGRATRRLYATCQAFFLSGEPASDENSSAQKSGRCSPLYRLSRLSPMHGAVRTLMIGVVALAALHYIRAADNESGRPPASAIKSVWDTVPWKSPRVARADHSSHRRWADSSPAATVAIAALSSAVENALLEAADTERRVGIDLCRASYIAFDDRLEAIQRIGRRALAAIPAGTAGGSSAKI